ncbi:MAG TPA: sugar phosphate isomerase/epimerase family protein [Terriglobia bacterium]|nr:sugar phosphate isomerase/epimerase family protein [Terriglobia bacterium]
MDRRTFLKGAALLPGTPAVRRRRSQDALTAQAASEFNIGAISDGFSGNFETALRIMKGYGLSWVEVRDIWGKYNTEATPGEIRRVKELLNQYRFRCSVVDSALYKCSLPGTTAVSSEPDAYPYSGQMDLLKRAMDRAHAWGAGKVRGFTFWRVARPADVFPRVAEELHKAAEVAESGGIRLVIENEEDCNAATGHELAAVLKLAPSRNLGYNWDVGNGYARGEVSYPDGYDALDKRRIWHLHLKGIQCAPGLKACRETFADEGVIDLAGQLQALRRIHYRETMSLECEFSAPGLTHLQTTRRSMEGLLRVVNKVAAG